MRKSIVLVIVLAVVIVVLTMVLLLVPKKVSSSKMATVCFNASTCFTSEIADTEQSREYGLMNRTHLDDNKGMLFVFDQEGDYPFWMKNTLIPLDMIWINKNHQIVFIQQNAQPCPATGLCSAIDPHQPAQYVLEINANLTQQKNIKVGDTATW